MDPEVAIDLSHEALIQALLLAGPVLGIGMVVGLAISVFQAVTQLQEQTLTFVPKIGAMVVAASYFIPWIANRMLDYAQQMFSAGPGG